tara:strand:+ start:1080 stop:2240 length:1161 start_codon:yes stop_codon:yes gene_type:complete
MSKIRHRSDIHIEGHLSASSADFGGLVSFAEDLAISGTLQFQHMSASSARIGESLVVGEDATVSGSFKVGNSMTVKAKEAESAYILLQADDSDDAGDDWKLTAGSTFTIGNDIASAGSDVAHVTITPNATVASSTTAVAGVIKIGGNKIQASDGGDTITLDTSDNVTIAGDLTVAGGDTTVGTAGNTTATTISVVTNTSTNAGKALVISAGSTTTNGSDINGGDLVLASGGGDGTGTSTIQFKTKIANIDAAAERMRIHTDGNVGIGTTGPDCMLHVAGAAAFSGPSETFVTFGSSDTTPSVATGNLFKTHASGQTLTMFDGGVAGQIINVISTAAVVYDVTGTNLKGGSADITTASGDVTTWVFDGTNWYLLNFMDVSADLSGGH